MTTNANRLNPHRQTRPVIRFTMRRGGCREQVAVNRRAFGECCPCLLDRYIIEPALMALGTSDTGAKRKNAPQRLRGVFRE